MPTAVLFLKPEPRSNPHPHQMVNWIKKLWYLHTKDQYSTTERNRALKYATTWMDLENIRQNERIQSQKTVLLHESTYMRFPK